MYKTLGPALKLVTEKKVLVTLGSGGVGKTTTAVALAVLGSLQGKRVGLLSIDPAKRLADAMGIQLGGQLTKVPFASDSGVGGSIHAAMLDQKSVFDEMVDHWAPNEGVKEKIFQNRIYKEVSENLGGPLEYMALAKLEAMVESGDFDLIVLDTPPDTHAIDFLNRPNALSGFTEGGVMKWMIKPFHLAQKMGAGKLVEVGGRLMSGISAITGVSMLRMLAEFLVLMEDVIKGFSVAGKKVSQVLRDNSTSFVLVAAPSYASVRAAETLAEELQKGHYPLDGLFLNRCMSDELEESLKRFEAAGIDKSLPGSHLLFKKRDQGHELQRKLQTYIAAKYGTTVPIVKIEEQRNFVHSLDAILGFAKNLQAATVL